MPDIAPKSWVRRRSKPPFASAFMRAYDTIKVNPENYLQHLRMAYDLPVVTYDGVYRVDSRCWTYCRRNYSRAHAHGCRRRRRTWHGRHCSPCFPTSVSSPAITLRMIQKLSLIYGFAYNTEEEEAELWVAAASAAGVDISRELVEKQMVSNSFPGDSAHRGQRKRGDRGEMWTARFPSSAPSSAPG